MFWRWCWAWCCCRPQILSPPCRLPMLALGPPGLPIPARNPPSPAAPVSAVCASGHTYQQGPQPPYKSPWLHVQRQRLVWVSDDPCSDSPSAWLSLPASGPDVPRIGWAHFHQRKPSGWESLVFVESMILLPRPWQVPRLWTVNWVHRVRKR